MRKSSLLKTHQRYMEMCQMDDQLTPEALRSSDMHWQQETLHTHNRNTLTHTLTHTHALRQRRLHDPRDKCFCAKL